MKIENLFILSWQNLMRNKRRLVISSLGVIFGIATLIFFFSLTSGARDLIFNHFLKKLPANQLRLNPKYKSDLGSFVLGRALSRSDNGEKDDKYKITFDNAEKISQLEGVQSVYGLQQIEANCYIYIPELPPADLASSRVGISAYATEYMADALPEGTDWKWEPGMDEVPMVISPQLLIAWNETFAETYEDLPNLDEKTIKQVPIYLRVVRRQPFARYDFRLKVAGLSHKAPFFAPLVPVDFVRNMNLQVHGSEHVERYSSLIVTMENPSYYGELMERFNAMGLEAGAEQRVAEMIDMGINVITLFLTAISLMIVFISLVNVFNIFLINVMERSFEIGVMRAVGASRWNIRSVILLESAFVGLVNGIIGSALGIFTVILVDPIFKPLIERFVVGQAGLFLVPPELILIVILVSPLVNVLAVFQPANYAARLNPVEALRR